MRRPPRPRREGISPGGILDGRQGARDQPRDDVRRLRHEAPTSTRRRASRSSRCWAFNAAACRSSTRRGDYVDCVWAEFVNDGTGATSGILAGGRLEPHHAEPDPNTPRHGRQRHGHRHHRTDDDIAMRYWRAAGTGGSCDFSTPNKGSFRGLDDNPVPINWINVYDDDAPGRNEPPMLHHFTLTPGTCGPSRVGFIYSPASARSPSTQRSRRALPPTRARRRHGRHRERDRRDGGRPERRRARRCRASRSPEAARTTRARSRSIPNEVSGTAVTRRTTRRSGRHGCGCGGGRRPVASAQARRGLHSAGPAPARSRRDGPATRAARHLHRGSARPRTARRGGVEWRRPDAELLGGRRPGHGPFHDHVTNLGVDKDAHRHLRESVQSSAEPDEDGRLRPRAAAQRARNAISDGCPVPVVGQQARPTRARPAPPLPAEPGTASARCRATRRATRQGLEDRFLCSMPNNWVDGVEPRQPQRRRPAVRLHHPHGLRPHFNVNPNTWLPVEGLPADLRHRLGQAARQPGDLRRRQRRPTARLRRQRRPALGPLRRRDHASDAVILGDIECDLAARNIHVLARSRPLS